MHPQSIGIQRRALPQVKIGPFSTLFNEILWWFTGFIGAGPTIDSILLCIIDVAELALKETLRPFNASIIELVILTTKLLPRKNNFQTGFTSTDLCRVGVYIWSLSQANVIDNLGISTRQK